MRGQATGALAAARHGDEHALGLLWREINPALIRYLRVRTGDDAEQLAAATWSVLSRDLLRFTGDDRAWRVHVFTVARRQVAAWRRQEATDRRAVAETDRRHVTSLSKTVDGIVTDVAIDVLASLPDEQAEALVLRTAAHLSTRDVSRVMRIHEGRVVAAIHAAAAGAAAVASNTEHRRDVDVGRSTQVRHPRDGPAHVAGFTGDDAAIDHLLAGRAIGPGAPPSLRLVADVLAALASPADHAELSGMGPAILAYRAHFAPRASGRTRSRRMGPVLAGSTVAASFVIGALVIGAYAAVLPEPLQRLAHALIHAPAPRPHPHPHPSVTTAGPVVGNGGGGAPSSASSRVPGRVPSTNGRARTGTRRHGAPSSPLVGQPAGSSGETSAPTAPNAAPTAGSATPGPPSVSGRRPEPTKGHNGPTHTHAPKSTHGAAASAIPTSSGESLRVTGRPG